MPIIGLLVALAGAAATVGYYVMRLNVLEKIPLPPYAYPIICVAGFLLYSFTRRSAD